MGLNESKVGDYLEKKDEKKGNNFSNVGYIIKLIWKADKGTVIYTLYKNISEIIFYVFFFVYLTQYIYTCIVDKTPFSNLFRMVSIACLLHVVTHLVSAGHAYYLKLRTPIVYKYIFDKVMDKSSDIELVRFEQPDFYDKFTRALDECLTRAYDTLLTLSYFLGYSISAVLAMGIIIKVDPVLIVFVIPPIFGSFFFGSKRNKVIYKMDMESTRDKRIAGYTKRVFYEKKYASEIRLYGIKNVLLGKHQDSYDNIYEINKKYRKKALKYQIFESLIFFVIAYAGAVIYITYTIKTGDGSQVGAYIAMVAAVSFVIGNITSAIEDCLILRSYDLYIGNLREFLEMKPKNKSDKSIEIKGSLDGIEFKNVTFTYEGATVPVIRNLSLKINKGERIALVGHNGAGKTTLIKLLMGLYDLTEGEITVGGNNICNYSKKEYYDHIGTVFQDLQIFSLPISENVLMRTPETDIDRQRVISALKKAQFGEKLSTLENGIDTMVSREFDENGIVLSGGEAQKLAIARVFAKDPDIVILDEPSSALDPIAEYNMYKNMMEVSDNKTVIFISHRLSSARVADKVYMMENGEILESGTHKDLMALDGEYAMMFKLQAMNYQESLPEDMEVAFHG